jgi:hypothetical protein
MGSSSARQRHGCDACDLSLLRWVTSTSCSLRCVTVCAAERSVLMMLESIKGAVTQIDEYVGMSGWLLTRGPQDADGAEIVLAARRDEREPWLVVADLNGAGAGPFPRGCVLRSVVGRHRDPSKSFSHSTGFTGATAGRPSECAPRSALRPGSGGSMQFIALADRVNCAAR